MLHALGTFQICQDASLLVNTAHVSGVLDQKEEDGTAAALVGTAQGSAMGVAMSRRDWKRLLDLCRSTGAIVLTLPVADDEHPEAELHVVAAQITLVGQTAPGEPRAVVTLAAGISFPVRLSGAEIVALLREEVRRVAEPMHKAIAQQELEAGAPVQ